MASLSGVITGNKLIIMGINNQSMHEHVQTQILKSFLKLSLEVLVATKMLQNEI